MYSMDSIFAFLYTQIQKEFKGILFMSLPPQRKRNKIVKNTLSYHKGIQVILL
jgi:hypothetical protein